MKRRLLALMLASLTVVSAAACSKDDTQTRYSGLLNLLQLDKNEALALDFGEDSVLNLLFKESDLRFGNWKRGVAYLG